MQKKMTCERQTCSLEGIIKTDRKAKDCDYVPWVKHDQDGV